jgi:hypothetical protein
MGVRNRVRPSPALIVAVLALVVALAGTAMAAPDLATKKVTKSKVKKISKKQANKQIKKKAPGLSVAHADTADQADNATNAESSTAPFAYAHVTEAGTVDTSRSKGITQANVLLNVGGIICWDIPFAFKTVQLTQDSSGATVDAITVHSAISNPPLGGCPAGTDLTTFSVAIPGGALNPEDFDMWFGN